MCFVYYLVTLLFSYHYLLSVQHMLSVFKGLEKLIIIIITTVNKTCIQVYVSAGFYGGKT